MFAKAQARAKVAEAGCHAIPQGHEHLAIVGNPIALSKMFQLDGRRAHHTRQITSAKLRSNLRKWCTPRNKRSRIIDKEIICPGQNSGALSPKTHQRKPSITPTIGFSEERARSPTRLWVISP